MTKLLRAEGLVYLLGGSYLYWQFGFSWVLFGALFFAPDFSFVGYLAGPKWGAITYNLLHTTLLSALLIAAGMLFEKQIFLMLGLISFAHIGFDRILGFGLKHTSGFKNTHLGNM